MPQMMPINWMISLIFFICIYMMFNIMNYYIYSNNYLNTNKNFSLKNNKQPIWKW
uniref:ATP synthase F0 subunit 8 n=1 Tax=Amplypterus panopus TaxID=522787 RepID=A0A6G6D7W5_9NEOP|nr:ATP synthase F0 subunit 8 [Amplypterus panopus]QIE12605.1 ATP synthase F0 subunit 8 [Amplypterus panopus]UZF97565.1 ATP synthase F0 subunit 8 [Amplypterus panopus]